MRPQFALPLIIGLLLLAGLACQTGEVLTPIEATKIAELTRTPSIDLTDSDAITGYEKGMKAVLTGKTFMVNLVAKPGTSRIIAQQERGAEVTIVATRILGQQGWIQVDAPTGLGWVKQEHVTLIEDQ